MCIKYPSRDVGWTVGYAQVRKFLAGDTHLILSDINSPKLGEQIRWPERAQKRD